MTFDRHTLDNLYRYCLLFTTNREDAEDLLHSSLENYLQQKTSEIRHPAAYIRRTIRNRFYDQLRRQNIIQFEPFNQDDIPSDIENNLETMMVDKMTIEKIWATMSLAEREVLFLWAIEEKSAAEIGRELDEPRSTILSRLYRVRKRLSAQYSTKAGGDHHD